MAVPATFVALPDSDCLRETLVGARRGPCVAWRNWRRCFAYLCRVPCMILRGHLDYLDLLIYGERLALSTWATIFLGHGGENEGERGVMLRYYIR